MVLLGDPVDHSSHGHSIGDVGRVNVRGSRGALVDASRQVSEETVAMIHQRKGGSFGGQACATLLRPRWMRRR